MNLSNINKIGVIVGRFQVPDLHEGHLHLIDSVVAKHKKVLLLLGSTPGVLVTRNNPLDYFTRKMMIQEKYPNIVILPLHDKPLDSQWSRGIDEKIQETFGDHVEATIYGSRDSFIPSYSGRFPTQELDTSYNISGSQVRKFISDEVRSTSDFRRGVVYASHNKHAITYTTVDIAIIKNSNSVDELEILLGRKKTDPDNKWRFIGGFVDPKKDKTLEQAAKREAVEETGNSLELSQNGKYLGSTYIDDWRYKNEQDQIITTVFSFNYVCGDAKAGDDIDDVKWFKLYPFNYNYLVDQHHCIMDIIQNSIDSL